MITDKDREAIRKFYKKLLLNTMPFSDEPALTMLCEKIETIQHESVEQARREAEAWKKIVMDGIAELEFEINECARCGKTDPMTEYDIYPTLTRGRDAILSPSVNEGKTDTEKLTIAVKALEDIKEMRWGDSWKVAHDALKEI